MGDVEFSIGDLLVGASTAAVQIEGGDRNNNWYDWGELPGKIKDGSSCVRSTDHWRRWREDTVLFTELGLQTYRMGIEWSRVEPRPAEFDADVMARYREEIGEIVDAGVVPLVTLHHFTNPSWFQGVGEWTIAESVEVWLRFVRHVVTELSDLVSDWVTINEPNVYATQCHLFKEGPPGRVSMANVWRVLRNMAVAHCHAYRTIHELQPEAMVGFAHHARVFEPLNAKNPVHQGFTRVNRFLFQDGIADAMLGGRFPAVLGRAPRDLGVGRYYDYVGLNYYSRTATSRMADGTFPGAPINDLGWEIYPDGIVETASRLVEKYPGPVWVTENGTCDNGGAGGELERFRARFIADHLRAIATSSVPFERYYHWCFVDNWEWIEGEASRFGLVHNDYETQTRTVKPSGRLLADIIANRGLTAAAHSEYVAGQQYPVLG